MKFVPIFAADAATAGMHHALPAWAAWGKGNVIVEKFFEGGPVMWPILAVFIVAVAVIMERLFWWTREGSRRDSAKLDQVYGALEQGNISAAANLARGSSDPLVRTVWHGLNHVHSSVEGALQVSCGEEIQRAGRFMSVMDTTITLAPLLGLLGTVTGIMGAFNAVQSGGLDPSKVSGGIGEALIATACGLAIAMFTLIFFNYYNARVARLQFELESTSNNVILMLNALRSKNQLETPNIATETDARQPQQFANTN